MRITDSLSRWRVVLWAGLVSALAWALPASAAPVAADPSQQAQPLAQPVSPEQAKFFEAKVRPLLAENCYKCHSDKKQKGHLRLDSLAAGLKGGENGPALIPGHPEKSRLIRAVAYTDEDLKMPPEERDRLSAEQVATLTEWVKMGAPWPAGSGAGATVVKSKRRTITPED